MARVFVPNGSNHDDVIDASEFVKLHPLVVIEGLPI
jgi:hypothetical protein